MDLDGRLADHDRLGDDREASVELASQYLVLLDRGHFNGRRMRIGRISLAACHDIQISSRWATHCGNSVRPPESRKKSWRTRWGSTGPLSARPNAPNATWAIARSA